jgi:hypothetical protein
MRLISLGAEPAMTIGLVVGIVALEPDHLRIALERQDMCGDAIEEPAIMADDHRAAGEHQQRLFQRAQGLDVQIIGRLVQEQQIAAALEHLGQMHPVALTAREIADALLLIRALEVEAPAIGARGHLVAPDGDDVRPA